MADDILLEVRGVTKTFTGTVALDEMDFTLKRGEVHAIVGENGAGKSTLMKIISGAYSKTSGSLFFEGREVELHGIEDAARLGISMIYQELENIGKLSVAENIFLGRLPRSRLPGFVSFRKLVSDARALMKEYALDINPREQLSRLSVAQQQFVEIIKSVTVKNAKAIIMDEPTSSLTQEETEKLFSIIRELKKRAISVIYISHRLDEVMDIADSLSVFRDGKNRGTQPRGEFQKEKIITLMIGHVLESRKQADRSSGALIFEVRNLSIRNRIRDFNVALREGEILGIAGLTGSGKDELVKCLFGLWPAVSKEIFYFGKPITIRHPRDAIKKGIVYLPEERKLQSLFLEMSVGENISLLWLFNVYRRWFLTRGREQKIIERQISDLSIKTASDKTEILFLSGGNQQKAILARLLAVAPKVMILNDPTRGVDVGSKEAIYEIIRALAARGTSILFLSSEIPEITHLANRVVVLSKGNIIGEFSGDKVTTVNILSCATRASYE
jgi:ABC-type sugar transport system ATPase subunit